MKITLSAWTLIFLFAALQSIALGLIIIFNRVKRSFRPNQWLVAFLICFGILLLIYVGYWNDLFSNQSFLFINQLYWPFLFALGPTFYLYLRTLLGFPISKIWHIVFPICILLLWIPYSWEISQAASASEVLAGVGYVAFFSNVSYFLNFLIVPFLFYYALATFSLIRKFQPSIHRIANEEIISHWVKTLAWSFLVFAVAHCLYFVLVSQFNFSVEWDYGISLIMVFTIFNIAYRSIHSPDLFKERAILEYKVKEHKELVSKEQTEIIIQNIHNLVVVEKNYLNEQIKLTDLSNMLSISPQQLSYVLNKKMNANFNDYINQFRIDHAKRMLADENFDHYKIVTIGYESGFNSKTSFYHTFKKFTLLTPSAFRKRSRALQSNLIEQKNTDGSR